MNGRQLIDKILRSICGRLESNVKYRHLACMSLLSTLLNLIFFKKCLEGGSKRLKCSICYTLKKS